MTEIEERLFDLRMRQVELARKVQINPATISHLVRKDYVPKIGRQKVLAAALKTTRRVLWPELFEEGNTKPKA